MLLNSKVHKTQIANLDGIFAFKDTSKVLKDDQIIQDGSFSTNFVQIFYNLPPNGNFYPNHKKMFTKLLLAQVNSVIMSFIVLRIWNKIREIINPRILCLLLLKTITTNSISGNWKILEIALLWLKMFTMAIISVRIVGMIQINEVAAHHT